MRIRKLDKTATVCWSPGQHEPLLAVGTVAGALDASFSSRTELELYSLNLDTSKGKMVRLGGVESNSRFNRLDWGSTGKGLIACGKENGELDIFSADRILSKKDPLVFRGNHAGPVRGLNFNPLQPQLASGGPDGEILIWDLNEFKSFEPGARSQRLEDITTLAWNRQVPHILATASNNGYTVVWDLRNRKEILKLPYPGGRRPITAVSWNPDAPTQLVLAGDDDANPMLYMWDLRNASAPERMLAGHTKGILSVDWCNKDSDLILSCGKDNRTIVWNASTAEPIGDLAHSANWSFDVKWCPRNPDLSVVASYDGKVSIHSLQSSSEQVDDVFSPPPPQHQEIVDPNDPFAQVMQQQIPQHVDETHFVLPHPPKWLKRPSGCRFSFGGQLVSFKNTGVSIHTIAAEKSFSDRVDHLEAALMAEAHDLNQYCHHMAKKATESDKDIWNYLATLFSETQQTDILDFVGFDGNRSSEVQRLLEKMVIEAPEKEPEQFNLFSTIKSEETDLDNYITKAVIVGDFELAVHLCLGSNRLSDALVLAYNGGEELLFKTQQEIFKRSKKPYLRLLNAIVSDDLKDVVEHCKVDQWKQILALISSYSKPEEYHGLCSLLGERLQSTPKPDTHAASLCFIGSGEFDRVVNLWLPAVERQKTLEKSNKEHYYLSLQQFVEKVSVLKAAIGFEDQELPYQLEEGESYTLEKLYGHLAKYCLIAANQGKLDACWRVLEMIPPSYGHETLDILRDRVYKSLNVAMGVTGQFPPFPFESVTVVGEQKPKEQYAYQPQNTQKPPVVNPFQPAVNRSSFQTQPFAPQQSYQPPSNPYQPPVNQFQPPPVVNQFQPPVNQFQPPVQQFQPAPVAPPPVQQFQPATNNQFQQSTQVNQLQPPSGFQQTPFIPQGPQRSGSFSAPQVSATTGHGQPIASTFQPPVFGVQSPVSPTVTKPLPEVKKETDRSQYTPAQRKVFDGLQAQWTKASASQTASEKRMIEDAEKRLELLYGQMHRQETPAQVVEELDQLVHALEKDDMAKCHKLSLDLMTKRFSVSGQWIVGIKRIIELRERQLKPVVPQKQQPAANTQPTGFGQPPAAVPSGFGPPPTSSFGQPPVGPPPVTGFNQPPVGPPPVTGFKQQVAPPPTSGFNQTQVAPPPTFSQPPVGPPPTSGFNQTQVAPPPTFSQPPVGPPPTSGFNQTQVAPPPTFNQPPVGPPPTSGFNQTQVAPPPTFNQPPVGPPPTSGFNAPRPSGPNQQAGQPIGQGFNQRPPSGNLGQMNGSHPRPPSSMQSGPRPANQQMPVRPKTGPTQPPQMNGPSPRPVMRPIGRQ